MLENSSDPKEKHNSALTHVETTHGTIILLGTAHISEDSVREVRETIENIRPDLVCIELDQNRYEALNEENRWKNLDIYQIIKQRKTFLLLSSLVLSSYQKRLGMDIGIRPGDEMSAAVQASAEFNIKTVMIDRDISVTLSRAWRKTRLWGKSKLIAVLLSSSFSREKADKETIENLKKHSALDDMMTEMANFLPTVKQVLIDERDEYLAIKTWEHIEELSRTGGGETGQAELSRTGGGETGSDGETARAELSETSGSGETARAE
ncbi:MAG: TraB family protein, partial [Salinispira sp.]